jgi:hypothetical protein
VIVTVTPDPALDATYRVPRCVLERFIAFAVCSCASAERASTLPESSSSESQAPPWGSGGPDGRRLVDGPSTTAITDSDSVETRRTLPVVPRVAAGALAL